MIENRLTTNEMILKLMTKIQMMQGDQVSVASLLTETCAKTLSVDTVGIWMRESGQTYSCVDWYETSTKRHVVTDSIGLDSYINFTDALLSERYLAIESVTTDTRTAEVVKDVWKNTSVSSMLLVPVYVSGKYWGFIQLNKSTTTTFTQDMISFMIQVSDLMSQAILTSQLKNTTRKVDALERISSTNVPSATASFDILSLLTTSLDLVSAECGMVFRSEQLHRQIVCVASLNTLYDMTGIRLNYGEDAAGIAVETNTTLILDDYRSFQKASSAVQSGIGYKTVVAVPIPGKKTIVGALVLAGKKSARSFTTEDQALLELFVQRISYQLEQDTLLETINYLQRKDTLIDHFSTIHRQVSHIDRMLSLSANLLQTSLKVDSSIIRVNGFHAVSGLDQASEQGMHTIIQKMSGFNTPVQINDWRTYTGTFSELAPLMDRLGFHSSVFVPIICKNTNVGYVCLSTRHITRYWREEEISAVTSACDQIENAVEYYSMQDRLNAQDQVISRIHSISENLNKLYSYEEASEIAGMEAVNILQADGCTILLRNPDGTVTSTWNTGVNVKKLNQVISMESSEISQYFMNVTVPTTFTDFSVSGFPLQVKRFVETEKIRTVVTVPLLYSSQIVGTVMLFFREVRRTTPDETRLLEIFSNQASLTLQNAWMFDQLEKGYIQIALSLAKAMDERDMMIPTSSIQIAQWAEKAADKLGLPEEEIRDLHWAALLHDIGKVSVPEDILSKPGKLAQNEWETVRQVPVKAEEIIQPITRFRSVGKIIRNMREHYDGSGYPDRLKGSEIPIASRILSVADAYENIVSDRPYHKARSAQEAVVELEKGSGKQFDPYVVKTFISTLEIEKQ